MVFLRLIVRDKTCSDLVENIYSKHCKALLSNNKRHKDKSNGNVHGYDQTVQDIYLEDLLGKLG